MKPMCRHCQQKPVNRPCGLCWSCYYRPGIRALYPSTSKFAAKAWQAETEASAGEPIQFLPRSQEKLNALIERAAKGQPLFHPDDADYPKE